MRSLSTASAYSAIWAICDRVLQEYCLQSAASAPPRSFLSSCARRRRAVFVATDYVLRYTDQDDRFVPGQGDRRPFDGRDTKQARKSCPSDLVRVARRKLDQLSQAAVLGDLRAPPSNRLEKLKGERAGQYSIRINDQWRVCFRWADSGAEDVQIVDYH